MKLSDAARKQKLLYQVNKWYIKINKIPYEEVQKRAIKRYNTFLYETCQSGKIKATASKDREFLDRITVNYIRHNLTNYNAMLDKISTKPDFVDAYILLNERTYNAIGDTYLNLKEECQRQLEGKK